MGGVFETLANYNPQATVLQNQLRRQQALESAANTQQLQQAAITGQLRNQQAAIDLRDQAILSDAFTKVAGDPDKAVPMAVQNGLSPMGYFKYQNDVNAYHQGLSKYQADQLALLEKQNSQLGEGYATLKGLQGQARQDAIPAFIRQAQQVQPGFQADPQSLMQDQYLDTQIGLHGFTGTQLARAKEQTAMRESAAKAAHEEQQTAEARYASAGRELAAMPTDETGAPAGGPAYDAFQKKYADILPGGIPRTKDDASRFILSTIPANERPKYLMDQMEVDAMRQFTAHPEQAKAQIHNLLANDPSAEQAYQTMFDSASTLQGKQDAIKAAATHVAALQQHLAEETDPRILKARINQAVATAVATERATGPIRTANELAKQTALTNASTDAFAGITNPTLHTQAVSQYGKDIDEYQNKVSDARALQDLVSVAQSGNKAAFGLIPIETVKSAINRVNRTELESVSKGAGSAVDKLQGFWGSWTAGKPIPPDILRDTARIAQLQENDAQQKYDLKRQKYGTLYGKVPAAVQVPAYQSPAQRALPQGAGRAADRGVVQQYLNAYGNDKDKTRQALTAAGWTIPAAQ